MYINKQLLQVHMPNEYFIHVTCLLIFPSETACCYVNCMVENNSSILSVYSPFSDRVGLPLHNIHNPSPFTSIMDIFFVDLKFGHIHFYTL